jgi:hypothetical protein
MARGKTLTSLINDLRAESRRSLNPAHNKQARDAQVNLIQRIQENLWEDFAWPHLRVRREVKLLAGQRYYDVPEDLDISRVEKIEVRFNNRWVELHDGIEAEHYAVYDSDLNERGWPVSRAMISEDEEVEVWPIPESDGDETTLEGMLRFTGIRKLRNLVDDADRADLDNRLIVLYGAAELLAADGAKDATLKLSQANKLYSKLRGGLMPRKRFKMFGDSDAPKTIFRGPPPIYYRVVT